MAAVVLLGGSLLNELPRHRNDAFEQYYDSCARQPGTGAETPAIGQQAGAPQPEKQWVASLDRPGQAVRQR